jgi:hypothetical protein
MVAVRGPGRLPGPGYRPDSGAEVASLEVFHDFPQGSLGAVVASYQPEEGNGNLQ